jgi:hypothetical protein
MGKLKPLGGSFGGKSNLSNTRNCKSGLTGAQKFLSSINLKLIPFAAHYNNIDIGIKFQFFSKF